MAHFLLEDHPNITRTLYQSPAAISSGNTRCIWGPTSVDRKTINSPRVTFFRQFEPRSGPCEMRVFGAYCLRHDSVYLSCIFGLERSPGSIIRAGSSFCFRSPCILHSLSTRYLGNLCLIASRGLQSGLCSSETQARIILMLIHTICVLARVLTRTTVLPQCYSRAFFSGLMRYETECLLS